jgi:hypothetical protein
MQSDELRLHRIGTEKIKVFENNFDKVYDFYKHKAISSGYWGDLKFIKERGKVIIYVEINLPPIEDVEEED